jgi:hypothetical protein
VPRTPLASLQGIDGLAQLESLTIDETPVTSLEPLAQLTRLDKVCIHADDSVLTSLGSIEQLSPAMLSVMRSPLDAEAVAAIARLCEAGWFVAWDGGTCGDYCKVAYCGDWRRAVPGKRESTP